MTPIDNSVSDLPGLGTASSQKRFPLTPRDCKILTAILDKFGVFTDYGYPQKALVAELAEMSNLDEDDCYYSLKFLRMARFT
jgi:hypothetical protein